MVDFQLLCYCPGITEVFRFLGSATNSTARKDNLDRYLQAYSNSFLRTAKSLGVRDSHLVKFRLPSLKSEVKARGTHLYAYQLFTNSILRRKIEKSEVFGMTEDEEIIRTLGGCGDATWEALGQAMDMINEVEEYGTIEVMKEIVAGLEV